MAVPQIPGLETYPGGKGSPGTYQTIINQIPPHEIFIEAFLGSGRIVRHMRKSKHTIGSELNPDTYNKWVACNFTWIELHRMPALELLRSVLSGLSKEELQQVVIYLDPPYPLGSRKSQQLLYGAFEMSDQDHVELLTFLLQLDGPFILISTYPNELYRKMLSDWRLKSFYSITRQGLALEHLYMNYAEPKKLHDYQYVGGDYRERERIKRKTKRWVNGLRRLPEHERQAIFESLAAVPMVEEEEEQVAEQKQCVSEALAAAPATNGDAAGNTARCGGRLQLDLFTMATPAI